MNVKCAGIRNRRLEVGDRASRLHKCRLPKYHPWAAAATGTIFATLDGLTRWVAVTVGFHHAISSFMQTFRVDEQRPEGREGGLKLCVESGGNLRSKRLII